MSLNKIVDLIQEKYKSLEFFVSSYIRTFLTKEVNNG